MKIVYFYILYLKNEEDVSIDVPEIHGRPFPTEQKAKEFKEKCDKHFGDRVQFSKIKKVDLSKHEKGIWL